MSNNKNLVDQLEGLSKQKLIVFIDSLYGLDHSLDERIERLLVSNDPKKQASLFKKAISSLKRRTAFVSYSEAHELGIEVEQLAADICNDLLPESADIVVDLLEKLLATGVNSLERCDDSGGDVGAAYHEIVILWLHAAKQTDKSEPHWIRKIKVFKADDDYSLFDPLLSNAGILLSEASLRELAFFYETELRKTKDDWEGLKKSVNVFSLAEALGDTELYERCLLFRSPEPNTMQLESFIRFCLEFGDEKRALKWLESKGERTPSWITLKIRSYLQLSQKEKLPDLCDQLLSISPTLDYLKIVMEVCPEQKDRWQAQVMSFLERADVTDQIELLLSLQQYDQAQKVALDNYQDLQQCYYGTLISLLESTPDDVALLKVVLYRCLLLDLLERGYSKAYRHGARYLTALRALDKEVSHYQSLKTHAQLESFLKEKHGRKRSFWALV